MSTLTTYLLARPNILYVGNTDVANGTTTLTDLTGTLAAGTEINTGVSRNGFGASGGPTGHSTSWASSGTEARGFQIAAAATATLQLQTLTYGVFFRQSTAANGPIYIGRQNGLTMSVGATQKVGLAMSGGGLTLARQASPSVAPLNVWHLAAVTYDGHEVQPWLDGQREGVASPLDGPFTSFLNRVVFGGDTGSLGAGHQLAIPFIAGRAMTDGELAQIARLGGVTTTSDHAAVFDFVSDALNPIISAGAEGENCVGCGGRRRATEGGYKSAISSPAYAGHLSCAGASSAFASDPNAPLTNTSTELEIDRAHARLTLRTLQTYLSRTTSGKPWYLASTGQNSGTGVTTQTYGGLLGSLGILHRRFSQDPASWFLQPMKLIMSYMRASQLPNNGTNFWYGEFSSNGTDSGIWSGNALFSVSEGLPGIVAVWDAIDASTRALWLDTLQKYGDMLWRVRGFWPNGNYILFYWSIMRYMVKIDPSIDWQARADYFLNFLFDTGRSITGSGYSSGWTSATIGVRRYVDSTPANDPLISLATMRTLNTATDKIYQTEGNGSATGPGNTYNTTYGFDQNYVTAATGICLSVYQVTGDSDAWKMAQLLANAIVAYQNFSGSTTTLQGFSVPAWYSQQRGTRHNTSELMAGAHWHTLRRLGRTDYITAQQEADRFKFMQNDAVLNTTSQNVWYRNAVSYAMELAASRYWPGWPSV